MTRSERAIQKIRGLGLDALLVTRDANIRYVSGFTGSESYVVLSPAARVFITDSRYTEQAENECEGFEVVRYRNPYPSIEETLARLAARLGIRRLGFERGSVTFDLYDRLSRGVDGVDLVPVPGVVEELRYAKEPSEIELVRKAAGIADRAFDDILLFIRPGVEEKDIETELEYRMRKHGASAAGSGIIVASGPRSSLPHAIPGRRKVEHGDFVTMDFGALYEGYRSDMTRTVVVGEADERQREIYGIVRKAQEAGLRALRAGVTGKEVDRAAREVIESAGLGERFGHGVGHGVGLEIHEEPFMSAECERTLVAGNIVTVEPGVYIPGWGGVRIEDTVVVGEDGCECLSRAPGELITV